MKNSGGGHGIVVYSFGVAAVSEGHCDSLFCSFAQDAGPDPFCWNLVSPSDVRLFNAVRKDVIAQGETHIKPQSRDHNPD